MSRLQIANNIMGITIGALVILGIIIAWVKGWIKHFRPFIKMANSVNAFMDKVVPDLLEGFEKKEILPTGSLVDWTKFLS
ncbi:hypothetical protein KAX35_09320 [candidate division WOR-3 bacterium]|nr:hypothetical protein [candidate division WOR-3 bacterium]